MIRIASIIFALTLSGCGIAHYESSTFYPDGALKSKCEVMVVRNAIDVSATNESLWLADGTVLQIVGGNEQPDKSVVVAVASIGQALFGAVAIVAKFFGL